MEAMARRIAVLSTLLWTHVGTLAFLGLLLAFKGGIVFPMVLEQIGYFIGMGLSNASSGPDGYALFFHFLALFTSALALYAFQRGESWLPPVAYGALVAGIFAAPLGLVTPALLVWLMRRPDFESMWHEARSLQPKAARRVGALWTAATVLVGILAALSFFGFVSGQMGWAVIVFLVSPGPQVGAWFWVQRLPSKKRKAESQEETGPMPRLPDVVHPEGPYD